MPNHRLQAKKDMLGFMKGSIMDCYVMQLKGYKYNDNDQKDPSGRFFLDQVGEKETRIAIFGHNFYKCFISLVEAEEYLEEL